MKEVWFYMSNSFSKPEKYWKRMKKAQRLCDFNEEVRKILEEQKIRIFN